MLWIGFDLVALAAIGGWGYIGYRHVKGLATEVSQDLSDVEDKFDSAIADLETRFAAAHSPAGVAPVANAAVGVKQ